MAVNIIQFVFLFVTMIVITTHNCNGLKNIDNFKRYVAFVDEKKYGLCLLQETFWNDNFETLFPICTMEK